MKFEPLKISDIIKIIPRVFKDDRGEFMESFKENLFHEAVGKPVKFVQDNQSLSLAKNTIRGLHFQTPPAAQGKLVRCVQGSIFDVAVDARKGSPTFGQWVGEILSPDNNVQLWIPEGFLHGFATLEPHTIIQYKCTDYYSPDSDGSIYWDDQDLNVDWRIDKQKAVLSEKDIKAPKFSEFDSPFYYDQN